MRDPFLRPWVFRSDYKCEHEYEYYVFDQEGDLLMSNAPFDFCVPNKEAAAFIVKAVNCHDDLVAALEYLVAGGIDLHVGEIALAKVRGDKP